MTKNRFPPGKWDSRYDKFAEWAAWLSGNPEELLDIYSAGFSINKGDYNFIENGIGYSTLHDVRGRFWGKNIQNERQTMLHVPVAGDIAATSSNLLFSEKPDVKIPEAHEENAPQEAKDEQDRLNYLIEVMDFYSRILELGETASALGGAYLKVNWDSSFRSFPVISVAQPDNAIPEFRWGFLQKVTFHKTIAKPDTNLRYRLLEIYKPGVIENQLWQGNPTDLGKRVPLSTFEMTADLEDEVMTGIDDLACRYIPNKLPNRLWRGSDMGQSDLSGIEGIMDAIDETYTSWMRDLRLARGRVVVPEHMLSKNTTTGNWDFDIDKEVYQALNMGPASDNESQKITPVQFDIRSQEHLETIMELMKQAYSLAGYSPATFGMDAGSTNNATATEIKAREGKSYKTRNKKAKYVQRALEEILHVALKIDAQHFGEATGNYKPQVNLQDSIQTDPLDKSDSIKKLSDAESMSIDTKVRMLHQNWSEKQIEAEVKRIKQENGMIVEDVETRA